VHARVSTNEHTPFQSRPLQDGIVARNNAPAHDGLTLQNVPLLGHLGLACGRVRDFRKISRTNTTTTAAFPSRIPMSGRHSTSDGSVVMDPSLARHGHDKHDCRWCCPVPKLEVVHSDAENGALREAARPRAQEHSVRHVRGQRADTQSAFTACGGPCSDDGCYAHPRTARDNQGARNQGVSTAALAQRRGKFSSHWTPLVATYTGRLGLEGCPGSRKLGHYT